MTKKNQRHLIIWIGCEDIFWLSSRLAFSTISAWRNRSVHICLYQWFRSGLSWRKKHSPLRDCISQVSLVAQQLCCQTIMNQQTGPMLSRGQFGSLSLNPAHLWRSISIFQWSTMAWAVRGKSKGELTTVSWDVCRVAGMGCSWSLRGAQRWEGLGGQFPGFEVPQCWVRVLLWLEGDRNQRDLTEPWYRPHRKRDEEMHLY